MSGFSNYLRNKLIDLFHRGVAYTPPATVYVTLCSTAPSASAAGTELTGTGYGRVAVSQGTTQWAATNADGSTASTSSGTSGVTSNNAAISFGTAGSAWGTASYWEVYDASSGGNRLFYGTITDAGGSPSPRSIASGDPVSFPISALRINWA